MSKARAAYYLVLIALLMPAPPQDDAAPTSIAASAVTVAQSDQVTGTQQSGFCVTQQRLCKATSYLLRKFEAKARYPIHVLNSWSRHAGVPPQDHRA